MNFENIDKTLVYYVTIEGLLIYIEEKNGNSKEYRQLKKFMVKNDVKFTYDNELKAFNVEKCSFDALSECECLELFELHLFYINSLGRIRSKQINRRTLSKVC